MRFQKSVLSQHLRTGCDLALYLTLFTPQELGRAGLPEALEARPGVGALKEAGVEQETLIFNRLRVALGQRCIGDAPGPDGRWRDQELIEQLQRVGAAPAVLIQSRFEINAFRLAIMNRLGANLADAQLIPQFNAFIPDVILVEAASPAMQELSPTGDRITLENNDGRLALTIIDVKHAQEANPSYEAEVALYGLMLANWLHDSGLNQRFFVCSAMYLWTRGGIADGSLQEAIDRGERDPINIIQAIRAELSEINLPIYIQSVRRFFSEKLPAVIRQGAADWTTLDWHVGPACASCDWLGFEGWLGPDDRPRVAAAPNHYCYSRAAIDGHLSRLPLISRGSRKVLESGGIRTVDQVARMNGDEAIYANHTNLKSERRAIPAYANAIINATNEIDANRPDGSLARFANLDIFLSINFDPGAGLLTGIGLKAYFRQQHPFGQRPDQVPGHQWSERWITTAKTPASEEASILAFLQYLAAIFEHATDLDAARGGPHAANGTAQIIFWDRRQFEELCFAIGRHLPAILYDRQDRLVKAIAWIFPPEELQEQDNIDARRPAIAFVRDIVRRLIRVPAPHALTLFNVVTHYHFHDDPFRAPDQFYREPLSDTIPRERIYEIWLLSAAGGQGNIRWGRVVKTQNQLIDGFSRTIDAQGRALSSITWRVRRDFGQRLMASAPRIQLTVPNWTPNVAYDAKLWIAWAKFENAFSKAAAHQIFVSDPEETEASNDGLRITRILEERADGTIEAEVSVESLNTKIQAPNGYLCLSVDAFAGFLALPASAVIPQAQFPQDLLHYRSQRLHHIFGVKLLELNRATRRAVFEYADIYGPRQYQQEMTRLRTAIRRAIAQDLRGNLTIVPSLGTDITVTRATRVLREIGNPPTAAPAVEAQAALGGAQRRIRPGADAITSASRVLWEGGVLSAQAIRPEAEADQISRVANVRAGLNPSQTTAVHRAARNALTIIWGPPGTGKTNTCSGLLHALVVEGNRQQRESPYAILISGPTYKAVGELVKRFGDSISQDQDAACKLYLINSASRDDNLPIPQNAGDHISIIETLADVNSQEFQDLAEDLANGNEIIVVAAITHQCFRIGEQLSRVWGNDHVMAQLFDFALIDESSQVDMATAMGPLSLLKDNFQLVITGDHRQMPPVFRCPPPLNAEYLVGSIQTYLQDRFNIAPVPLLQNYRSNADIVSYTRRLGYPPALAAANPETRLRLLRDIDDVAIRQRQLPISDAWQELIDPERPIVALTYPDGMAGQANQFEADCVASIALLLRSTVSCALHGQPRQPPDGDWVEDEFWKRGIGVVTPHRAQRAQVIQSLIRAFPLTRPDLIESAVDTVERFQGGERHTIIISFGVGDPDVIRGEERFLMQLERTNVAISRAMAKCIVLMSEEIAGHIPDDREAAANAHALRGIVDEWCTQRVQHPVTLADATERTVTIRWR